MCQNEEQTLGAIHVSQVPESGWPRPHSDRFWLLELRVSRTFLDKLRPKDGAGQVSTGGGNPACGVGPVRFFSMRRARVRDSKRIPGQTAPAFAASIARPGEPITL